MAFDPVITETAIQFLTDLSAAERAAFFRGLTLLCLDPFPNGKTRFELPFPYRRNTLGTSFGDFWVAYTLSPGNELLVITVYWSPESGRNPGSFLL